MSNSIPPPAQQGGGNAKYAILGLLLLLVAGGVIFFITRKNGGDTAANHPTPPQPPPVVDAGPQQPVGPQVGANFELPQEEPDAGQPETQDAGRPHVRYVYRYVSACPGSVDGPRVSTVVRQNYGGLRECYNRQLRSNPNLRGNITAEWVIQPNGSVGQINTSGAVARDRTFKSCFESSLSRMRFPQPRGGCAVFQQSFNFTPDGA